MHAQCEKSGLGAAANAVAALFRDMKQTGTDAGYVAANPGPYHDPMNLMKAARLDYYVDIEKKYTAGL